MKSCFYIDDIFRKIFELYLMLVFEPKYKVFRIFSRLSVRLLQQHAETRTWNQMDFSLFIVGVQLQN